jgi:hypothetical protein
VVDGTKRARCHDGAAPLRRGLPPPLEAAPAATVGRTVRGPDAAATAGAGRGGAATRGTAAMAIASAVPQNPPVSLRCSTLISGRWGLRRRINPLE